MKMLFTLAFVLAASFAHASGDMAVPKKTAMAKSPPPVVVVPGETRDQCVARVTAKCDVATWTKLGKRACVRWRARACR